LPSDKSTEAKPPTAGPGVPPPAAASPLSPAMVRGVPCLWLLRATSGRLRSGEHPRGLEPLPLGVLAFAARFPRPPSLLGFLGRRCRQSRPGAARRCSSRIAWRRWGRAPAVRHGRGDARSSCCGEVGSPHHKRRGDDELQ
jgi:hypothetical protein